MWFSLLAAPLFAAAPSTVTVRPVALPAGAPGRAEIVVERFGRYSIEAKSPSGAAVQVVDRQTGPGPMVVEAGKAAGRVDLFLERGATALRTPGTIGAGGEITLAVAPFVERNPAGATLRPGSSLEGSLLDHEQRSWQIAAPAGARLELELAGAQLADLRLWRDGEWLAPAQPRCATERPGGAAARRRCTLEADLDGGSYTVVAYGGPAVEPGAGGALFARWGIPPLSFDEQLTIGPFGVEHRRVPAGFNRFLLQLPTVQEAGLSIHPDAAGQVFGEQGPELHLSKEAREPSLLLSNDGGARILTVEGRPGAVASLSARTLLKGNSLPLPAGEQRVLLSRAGDPRDWPELTAVVGGADNALLTEAAIPLSPTTGWRRRFNLGGETVFFFKVEAAVEAVVEIEGLVGTFWLEPLYFGRRPPGMAPPIERRSGEHLRLEPGLHTLRLHTQTPGIATVTVSAAGSAPPPLLPNRLGVQLPDLTIVKGATVYIGTAPGALDGASRRQLPEDLSADHPLLLVAGQPSAVPLRLGEGRQVELIGGPVGALLRVDGGAWAAKAMVAAGSHTIEVQAPTAGLVSLRGRVVDEAKAPPVARLPLLEAALPFDLAAGAAQNVRLRVGAAGFYELASEGLLATEVMLGGRVSGAGDWASGGGAGRNFALHRYLGAGDYLVTVRTVGESAGHGRLVLRPRPMREGGALRPGQVGRAALEAGEGLGYTLIVEEAGLYTVRAEGAAADAVVRLEDADGWPLRTPGEPLSEALQLPAGRYRLLLLPSGKAGRRQVSFARADGGAGEIAGHGPVRVTLGQGMARTWWESPERSPDQWWLRLEAPTHLRIEASDEMAGALLKGELMVAQLPVGRPVELDLGPGDYRIDLRQARRSNGVTYTLNVDSRSLVPGSTRPLSVGGATPVSIGAAGYYLLQSAGRADTRLSLRSAGGARVAANDDAGADWNSALLVFLEPGAYTLHAAVLDGEADGATVSLRSVPAAAAPALGADAAVTVDLSTSLALIPLTLPEDALVELRAQGSEGLRMGLEVQEGGQWRTLGEADGVAPRLRLRSGGGAPLRLRVASLDPRGSRAMVTMAAARPRSVGEGAAAMGVGGGALRVKIDGPGLFAVEGGAELWWCPAAGQPCRPRPDGAIPGEEALTLWSSGEARLRLQRLLPLPGEVIPLADGGVMGFSGEGPLLVRVVGEDPTLALSDTVGAARGQSGAPGRRSGLLADGRRARVVVGGAAASVQAWRLGMPLEVTLTGSVFSGMVPAGGSLRLAIPAGAGGLRLVLPGELVAGVLEGGVVADVFDGEGRGLDVSLGARPGALLLVNPSREALPARILAVEAGPTALLAGGVIERAEAQAGERSIAVAEGLLRLAGATGTLITADGAVLTGARFAVPKGGGRLRVHHGAGAWRAWTEGAAWGALERPRPEGLDLPARLTLSGLAQAWTVELAAPGAVLASSTDPLLLEVNSPGRPPDVVAIGPGSAVLGLPAGRSQLSVRGLGGAPLAGALSLQGLDLMPITEGIGPPVALAAGVGVAYRLERDRAGRIGLGLRGDADGATLSLFGADGALLAQGPALMPELAPGAYVLVVTAADRPLRVQPVLLGTVDPGTLPPRDVVMTYVSSVEAE